MQEIIKILEKVSYKHSILYMFQDFIALMALEISVKIECLIKDVSNRIEQIKVITKKYNEEEIKYYEQFKQLVSKEISENRFQDFFGVLFHELSLQNKYKGQFFTPYTVSYAIAKMNIGNLEKEKDIIYIGEPSGGSGGMCIAACQVTEEQGLNYSSKLLFEVNDIDINCVYMSYIQLSLIGAAARINHKNSLSSEYFDSFITLGAIANRSFERLKTQKRMENMLAIIKEMKSYDFTEEKIIEEIKEDSKEEQYMFNF